MFELLKSLNFRAELLKTCGSRAYFRAEPRLDPPLDDESPNENDENAEKMLPNHCSDQANEKFENSPITENAQVCCQGSPII